MITNTIMPTHINTNERSSRGVAVAGKVVIPTAQWTPLKNFASLWKIEFTVRLYRIK